MAKKKPVVESKPPEAAPAHRCKLCPDGGVGKALVDVVDAARQKSWACVQHAAFYGRERTNANRKYLPGNTPAEVKPARVPVAVPDVDDDEEDDGPKIRMRDRK